MGLRSELRSLYSGKAGGTNGLIVVCPAQAAPLNVFHPIFTITGGTVLITSLVGYRTVVQAGGASNADLQTDPTIGAAVSLCAVLAVTGDLAGIIYTITGNATDAMQSGRAVFGGMAGGLLATGINMHGWLCAAGTIDWRESAAAGTGPVEWYLSYVPINPAAYVTPI